MRAKKALLAALASLLALATAALFATFDAPGLGRELEERVRTAAGIRLEVARSRFSVLRGLLLEDVRATAGSHELRVPRVVLEHRLLPLLRGRWELTGIRVGEARIGAFSIEALDLRLSRFDYDPRAITPVHGIGASGKLGAERVRFENEELRHLTASLAVDGGRFRFEPLRAAANGGELEGALALDFNSLPFRYRASLLGPSFSVAGLGPGELRVEAEGFGARARNLKARGSFGLGAGRLPDAAWIRELDPSLAGADHAPVEIPFEIRDERAYLDRVEIEIGGRVIAIEGSVGLDGSRELRVF